jgi:transcription initiation factor TFIIH subunit 1
MVDDISQQHQSQDQLDMASRYDPVVHKKTEGKLILDVNSFRFQNATAQAKDDNNNNNNNTFVVDLTWNKISKHQVSPASHPKSLLKIVLIEGAGKPLTFLLTDRLELERIRKEISDRLKQSESQHSSLLQCVAPPPSTPTSSSSTSSLLSGNKRRHSSSSSSFSSSKKQALLATGKTTKVSFGELDPTSLAVTRSSLLASNPTLRSQHKYLVEESQTVTEEDFWITHQGLLEEEYARIAGIARAGTSSLLQSHLQVLTGRVTLGVEEMRQIFILYPAVHKAYEEKVPLELSDEQFWRKYLESEYFHRDRGRVGASARRPNNNGSGNDDPDGGGAKKKNSNDSNNNGEKKDGNNKPSGKEQEARAAAVGTDDLFSRYDQKLRASGKLDDGVFFGGTLNGGAGGGGDSNHHSYHGDKVKRKKWGTHLAIGQFDLASTFETERGQLLEGPKDNHPIDRDDTDKIGRKVIQKYNRHWAMVLNPEEAVAGSNLMDVARNSVQDSIPNDEDAMAGGGLDDEMQRLVGFAEASSEDANHALGVGESDEYELLTLKNIEGYYSGSSQSKNNGGGTNNNNNNETEEQTRKKNGIFANAIVGKMNALVKDFSGGAQQKTQLEDAFPPPELGRQFLMALTKRMAADSKTDADTLEVVNSLPVDFKKRLHSYFRRTSELLRHFFGLRRLADSSPAGTNNNSAYNQKLKKIVKGLETLYNEIGDMRKEQEVTGFQGKTMGRMCFQIMEQLDWAFKLYREGTGSGGGGGFVTIEEF